MQKLDFSEAVELIHSQDSRFDRDAYFFLRDALDFTVKLRKKSRDGEVSGHVTGQQLLETQTLAEAKVLDGDDLRIQPEITAG